MSDELRKTPMRPGAYEELWQGHKAYYGDESWARVDLKDLCDKYDELRALLQELLKNELTGDGLVYLEARLEGGRELIERAKKAME